MSHAKTVCTVFFVLLIFALLGWRLACEYDLFPGAGLTPGVSSGEELEKNLEREITKVVSRDEAVIDLKDCRIFLHNVEMHLGKDESKWSVEILRTSDLKRRRITFLESLYPDLKVAAR
jgi:hypothetical protein